MLTRVCIGLFFLSSFLTISFLLSSLPFSLLPFLPSSIPSIPPSFSFHPPIWQYSDSLLAGILQTPWQCQESNPDQSCLLYCSSSSLSDVPFPHTEKQHGVQ